MAAGVGGGGAKAFVARPVAEQSGFVAIEGDVEVVDDLRRGAHARPDAGLVNLACEVFAKAGIAADADVVVGGVRGEVGDEDGLVIFVEGDADAGLEDGGDVLPGIQVHGEAGGAGVFAGEDVPDAAFVQDGPVMAAVVGADDVVASAAGGGGIGPRFQGEAGRTAALVNVQAGGDIVVAVELERLAVVDDPVEVAAAVVGEGEGDLAAGVDGQGGADGGGGNGDNRGINGGAVDGEGEDGGDGVVGGEGEGGGENAGIFRPIHNCHDLAAAPEWKHEARRRRRQFRRVGGYVKYAQVFRPRIRHREGQRACVTGETCAEVQQRRRDYGMGLADDGQCEGRG